jgi:hypothetical protein
MLCFEIQQGCLFCLVFTISLAENEPLTLVIASFSATIWSAEALTAGLTSQTYNECH